MTKEFFTNKGTKRGLVGVTLLGTAEGAGIGFVLGNPVAGAVVGGATAYTAERSRQALVKNMQSGESETVIPQQTEMSASLSDQGAPVDITIESTSTTKRIDMPEEDSQPIVKTSVEQANSVPMNNVVDALASMRVNVRANTMPMWQTTIQEKTVASTSGTAVYTHTPHRVG